MFRRGEPWVVDIDDYRWYLETMKSINPRAAYYREYARRRRADPAFRERARKSECERLLNPDYKERIRRLMVKHRLKRRTLFFALMGEFRSSGCAVCGESDPACLDAHHIDPESKEFNVSTINGHTLDADKIRAELAKCVCLCSNCHRKLHRRDF